MQDFTVAIIGGGIGGLALAISCVRRGIKVQVYEQAHAFAEIGAGVSFGPNALRALAKIDPALEQGYQRCATQNAWPEKKTTWFDFRVGKWPDDDDDRTDTYHIVNVQSPPSGQSSVHRAHFLDEMAKLIPPGTAHFNKKLADIKHSNNEDYYELLFADGSSDTASLVIGCDGVKSRTRQLVLGENDAAVSPQFSGKYAYRGLVPMDVAVAALGEELARNSQMYFGPGGHILTFPIEKGDTMNVVAFRTAAKWDRPEWVIPTDHSEMRRDFAGWLEPAQRILALMQKADKWALFDHPPARTFYKGRLVLLGDAAHASTPHQGAGAGQAIEDALVLSELLRTWRGSSSSSGVPVEKVIAGYDAVRRPRSQKVVTTSRLTGMMYDWEHPDCGSDLDKIRAYSLERFSWIWDEDLDEQIRVAVDMAS
jgi:salicylate hydroxylase